MYSIWRDLIDNENFGELLAITSMTTCFICLVSDGFDNLFPSTSLERLYLVVSHAGFTTFM